MYANSRPQVILWSCVLLLLVVFPVAAHGQDARPPAFVVNIRDGHAQGNPVSGVTVVMSVTTSLGTQRWQGETDAQGQVRIAEAEHEVVLLGATEAGMSYYVPMNNLETHALHIPIPEGEAPPVEVTLSRVDPNRLTFDVVLVEHPDGPLSIIKQTPVAHLPALIPATARVEGNGGGTNTYMTILAVVLMVFPLIFGGAVWFFRVRKPKIERNINEPGEFWR